MLFIFRPAKDATDPVEQLVHEFAEEVVKNAHCEITDMACLGGDIAKFKDQLKASESSGALFLAYSHGSCDGLFIYGRGDISIKPTDAGIFKGKSCYLVACSALVGLGKALKNAGALGVIGYMRLLWVPLREEEDKEILKRCINSGVIHWLKSGCTILEIYDVIRETYKQELEKLDALSCDGMERVLLYGILRCNLGSLRLL